MVRLTPAHWSGMLSIAEAAAMTARKPVTIRQWLFRGRLHPDGLDEHDRPLFRPETVRDAETLVRENGIRHNGSDPRRAKPAPAQQLPVQSLPPPDIEASGIDSPQLRGLPALGREPRRPGNAEPSEAAA